MYIRFVDECHAHMVQELGTGQAFLVSGSGRCSSCTP